MVYYLGRYITCTVPGMQECYVNDNCIFFTCDKMQEKRVLVTLGFQEKSIEPLDR